ncbi:MAG TPA: hypothetical protein VFT19_07270 [Solirubrobacterales bacterium]|nr:hypothetical protein [Solirubrobacterales bacterium]
MAAGCGGGDSDSSGGSSAVTGSTEAAGSADGGEAGPSLTDTGESLPESSLSKAQYIKRANELCARSQKERQAATRAYIKESAGKSGNQVESLIEDVYAPMTEAMLAELRALGAPSGDADAVEALVIALERRLEGTVAGGGLPEKQFKEVRQAERQAQSYGLTACHG